MSNWLFTGNVWTDAANWSAGVPTGVGATASFNTSSNGGGVFLAAIPDFATITLGILNVTLTGSTGLLIRGAIGDGTGVGTLVFNGGASVAAVTVNNGPATGEFEISATAGLAVQLVSTTIFNITSLGGVARINAPISGSGSLVKEGAGTLILGSANTLTGVIQVAGGVLEAFSDSALGSSEILIGNNATFRSSSTVNNLIRTPNGATGIPSDAQIVAATGDNLFLSGTLNHLSQGTISFGSATDAGDIFIRLNVIGENATNSSYRIAGGRLVMDSSIAAQNLFSRPGSGLTEISSGAIFDTNNHAVTISNLDMDGGTIRSSAGTLRVTVNDIAGGITQTGTLEGTAGNDLFTANAAGSFSMSGLTLLNWAATDVITLNGSANGNILSGSTGNDLIRGLDGNDDLRGGGGVDSIFGDNGNDLIQLLATNTGASVHGGADSDTLRVGGAVSLGGISGFEALDLVGGADLTLTGAQFASGFVPLSTLSGTGSIIVNLSAGDQQVLARAMTIAGGSNIDFTVNGSSGVDIIKGVLGTINDLRGNGGIDQIVGGSLADVINGGADGDKIRGDGGADTLTGGTGVDVFKFRQASDSTVAAQDTITDFLSGTDKLNFKRIDTNISLAGDQDFTFVGTGGFAGGGTASIRWVDLGANLRVEADVNGDGIADMHVLLQGAGAQTLTIADFVL